MGGAIGLVGMSVELLMGGALGVAFEEGLLDIPATKLDKRLRLERSSVVGVVRGVTGAEFGVLETVLRNRAVGGATVDGRGLTLLVASDSVSVCCLLTAGVDLTGATRGMGVWLLSLLEKSIDIVGVACLARVKVVGVSIVRVLSPASPPLCRTANVCLLNREEGGRRRVAC